jgi:hypothetical protein
VHVLELYWEPVPQYFEHDPNLKIRTIPFIDLNSVKFVCDRITHISCQIEKIEWAMKTVRARDTVNIGHRRLCEPETLSTLGTEDCASQRHCQHWAMKTVRARDTVNIGHRRLCEPETLSTLGIEDTVRSKQNKKKNHNTT